MSKDRKPKKLRRPNVVAESGRADVAPVRAGAASVPAEPRPASRRELAEFDYTHVRTDLRRIGVLAGSFLVILIALSFIIR